jgi:hypothetical protein
MYYSKFVHLSKGRGEAGIPGEPGEPAQGVARLQRLVSLPRGSHRLPGLVLAAVGLKPQTSALFRTPTPHQAAIIFQNL